MLIGFLIFQRWELLLLDLLGWDLACCTPHTVLDQLLHRIAAEDDADGNLLLSSSSFDLATIRNHAETFLSLLATDHAYCLAPRPLLAVSCLVAAFHGMGRTTRDADIVSALAANLCHVAAVSEKDVVAGVQVVEEMVRERVPGSSTSKPPPICVKNKTAPAASSTKVCVASPTTSNSSTTTPTDMMEVATF